MSTEDEGTTTTVVAEVIYKLYAPLSTDFDNRTELTSARGTFNPPIARTFGRGLTLLLLLLRRRDGRHCRDHRRRVVDAVAERRRLLRPPQLALQRHRARRLRGHGQSDAVRRCSDRVLDARSLRRQPLPIHEQLLLGAQHVLPAVGRGDPEGGRGGEAPDDPLLPVDPVHPARPGTVLLPTVGRLAHAEQPGGGRLRRHPLGGQRTVVGGRREDATDEDAARCQPDESLPAESTRKRRDERAKDMQPELQSVLRPQVGATTAGVRRYPLNSVTFASTPSSTPVCPLRPVFKAN